MQRLLFRNAENWLMYVGTPNVDETATRIAQLRGGVLKQPADIPGTGRFAVVPDPHGACCRDGRG